MDFVKEQMGNHGFVTENRNLEEEKKHKTDKDAVVIKASGQVKLGGIHL